MLWTLCYLVRFVVLCIGLLARSSCTVSGLSVLLTLSESLCQCYAMITILITQYETRMECSRSFEFASFTIRLQGTMTGPSPESYAGERTGTPLRLVSVYAWIYRDASAR